MFYVGLPAQFPLLTVSRPKSSQGLGAGLQNITIHWGKGVFFILYFSLFATSSPTHSPSSSALSACACFFCCSYSRPSSRFFTTSLSPTPTSVSNLVAHSILIRIYWAFIRDQRKKRVPRPAISERSQVTNAGLLTMAMTIVSMQQLISGCNLRQSSLCSINQHLSQGAITECCDFYERVLFVSCRRPLVWVFP
jgi:hypothetical protein